jgi:uncharacterized tellurite resistance protein B-like protein
MSLFAKLASLRATPSKPADDVLLIHAMMLVAGADGRVDDAEIQTVEAFVATIPELRDKPFNSLIAKAHKLVARAGSVAASIPLVSELSTPTLRKKAFVLAADIAMSSGDIDEKEATLLEHLRGLLGVDDETAAKIIDVLAMKYAK